MEGKNLFGTEGNHNGHPPRWIGVDRGVVSSGGMEAKVRENGQGEEDPGERWFRQENSWAEIRTLSHLEDDPNSTLLFEHRGSQRATQLWLTPILLGHLSQERMALGKAMEVFAKL